MGFENSGRRPKSTALRMLQGNPGKRGINPDEPKPHGAVMKPVGLSEGADRVWEELAPICLGMGTLTAADVKPFAMLCELEASVNLSRQWKQHRHKKTMQAGLQLEQKLASLIRPYYALFGLEPVSRSRIHVAKSAEKTADKWAAKLA
jgi:phage terminase small subunit